MPDSGLLELRAKGEATAYRSLTSL